MTPAQRIRKAALGAGVFQWLSLDDESFDAVADRIARSDSALFAIWAQMNDTERRMFLLFVAEALENE